MCDYIPKRNLNDDKQLFQSWVNEVHGIMKKEHGITFTHILIGSGKRNLVIKKCNEKKYDLDYQLTIQKVPKNIKFDRDAKQIKYWFKDAFDRTKPEGFKDCEDSKQALTAKCIDGKFGYDIIIVRYDEKENFRILYNKKNTNGANNNDYCWQEKSDMKRHRENFAQIRGAEMWNYLRKNYKDKRHDYKDKNDKKSYQILNESVNETLDHFGIDIIK